jgi:prepilin-type N-terminal cleavage/methylation domain-containing protein
MIRRRNNSSLASNRQAGFSLLEVLISTVVLTIGLVALLGVFGTAIAATQSSQQDMIAKQLASEAMESIFTARNTSQIQWLQIQNIGAGTTPDGIFVVGPQPINNPGADGIIGTADDATAGAMTLQMPGPDGVVGTSDDPPPMQLTNYQRTIQIAPIANTASLRTVTITITYTTPQLNRVKNYVLSGYISQYR